MLLDHLTPDATLADLPAHDLQVSPDTLTHLVAHEFMSSFVVPAVGILLLGHGLGLPGVGTWAPAEYTSLALGTVVAVLGLIFGRTRRATR